MNVQEATTRILKALALEGDHQNRSEVEYILSKFSKKNHYTDKLIQAGKNMRDAQREYFHFKGHHYLNNAKVREQEFDKLLLQEPEQPQQTKLDL